MDSFGFAGIAQPCYRGTRYCGRLRNYYQWVSVPKEDLPKFRYRELFRSKSEKIMVQDVLGVRRNIKYLCPDYLLHDEKPE